VDEGVLWRATRSPDERAAKSVAGAAMTPVAAMAAVTMEVKETILNVRTLSKWRCYLLEVMLGSDWPWWGSMRRTTQGVFIDFVKYVDNGMKISSRLPGSVSRVTEDMVMVCYGYLSACS
jgi:hypothetical protein